MVIRIHAAGLSAEGSSKAKGSPEAEEPAMILRQSFR